MKKIFIILLLFLSPIFVYANERVDVKIEYIDNVYWNYYRNNILYSGQLSYIYVGDKIGFGTNIRESFNSNSYVRLDREISDSYIITMGYFGYGYNGENTLKDYMATQKIIWGYTNSEEVYFTTGLNSTGSIINIDEYVNKIYDRYNNQAKFPNYGTGVKYLLGTTTSKYAKTPVSTPLKVVNETTNNINVDKNGNIIFTANEVGNNIFSLETNYESYEPNYEYISTGAQPIVTIGSNDVSVKKYYYEVIGGSININVKFNKNSNEKITNNKFELYDFNNKLVGVYSPSEDGNILINNLSAGKYTLKHINISEGYVTENDEYIFEINESNININKEIILKLKTSKISINRTYGNIILNDINYNSGVNYIIYDENNNCINEVKTDENGYVEFLLDYGNYKIQEKSLKNTRQYSNGIIIDKTMFESDNHFNIHNYEYKTNLKVNTLNKYTNEYIDDVKFIFNDKEYKTNEDGIFIIKDLEFGIYNFSEINVNGFYKIDSFTFEINNKNNFYIENSEPYTDVKLYLEKIEEKKENEEIEDEEIIDDKLNDAIINNEDSNMKKEEDLNDKKEEIIIIPIDKTDETIKEELIVDKEDILVSNKEEQKDEVLADDNEEIIKEEVLVNEQEENKEESNNDFIIKEEIEKLPFLGDNKINNEESKILYYICSFIKFSWL